MSADKESQLLPNMSSTPRIRREVRYHRPLLFSTILLSVILWCRPSNCKWFETNAVEPQYGFDAFDLNSYESPCPQTNPIHTTTHADLLTELNVLFRTEQYRTHAYESLGGAVRIPTESQDEEKSPREDPEFWRPFRDFHEYLEQRFPLTYSTLEITKINTYGLVFHWQGFNDTLKPILLTGHQDVVPVEPETVSQWIQPPYSGYYDGEWIWGRGSCDDKSGVIGILTTIETLLEHNFEPQRTIVLAFGIDEERGGVYGAGVISEFLLDSYGPNSFSILVDEGSGTEERFGAIFAVPSVAEKGKIDLRLQVSTPGGHSSVPPAHTSIGILATLITELERNPHPNSLHREGTYYQEWLCLAEHGPLIPQSLGNLIKESQHSDDALRELERTLSGTYRDFQASTGTTQAVDIIRGGVKSNALPEKAYAVVNHRISDFSSVAEVKARFVDILSPIAEQFNLSINAFEDESLSHRNEYALGELELSDAFGTALNPAPVSPTYGSGPWQLLSGSILSTLASSQRDGTKEIKAAVAPGLAIGNTDTRFYWNLTEHIFRYSHLDITDLYNGGHTINEALRAEAFLELIRFFHILILNADDSELLE